MLFLFFASGLYADKITAANKYVTRMADQIRSSSESILTYLQSALEHKYTVYVIYANALASAET